MKRNSIRDITQQRLILSELPETERKLVITIMVRTKWATDNFLTVAGRIRENKQLHRGIAKRYLRECCTICENTQEWIKATAMHSAEWEAVQDACLALHKEICGKNIYHVNLLKQLRDSLIDFSDTKHSEEIKSILADFGATNDIMNFLIVMNALNIYDYRPITYMARMGGDLVFNIPNAQKAHSATALAKFLLTIPKLSEELCKNANVDVARRDVPYAMKVLDRIYKLLAGNECNITKHYDAALAENVDEEYNLTVNMEKRRRFLKKQLETADKRRKFADAFEKSLDEAKYGPKNGESFEEYKFRILGSAHEVRKFNLSSLALKRAEGLTDIEQRQLDMALLKEAEKNGITNLVEREKTKIEQNDNFMKVCDHYYLSDITPLTKRTLQILEAHGISTVGDIVKRQVAEIKALKGIGPKTWANIVEGLNYLDINVEKGNEND